MVESDDDGVVEAGVDARGFEVVQLSEQFGAQAALEAKVGQCHLAEAVLFLKALAQVMHDQASTQEYIIDYDKVRDRIVYVNT